MQLDCITVRCFTSEDEALLRRHGGRLQSRDGATLGADGRVITPRHALYCVPARQAIALGLITLGDELREVADAGRKETADGG